MADFDAISPAAAGVMDLSSMNVIAPAANIGSAPRMKMRCNGAFRAMRAPAITGPISAPTLAAAKAAPAPVQRMKVG